jgi:hypothetical protein
MSTRDQFLTIDKFLTYVRDVPALQQVHQLNENWWPVGLILFLICTIAAYAVGPPNAGLASLRGAPGWAKVITYVMLCLFWMALGWWTGGGPLVVFGGFSVTLAILFGLVGLWAAARVTGFLFGNL